MRLRAISSELLAFIVITYQNGRAADFQHRKFTRSWLARLLLPPPLAALGALIEWMLVAYRRARTGRITPISRLLLLQPLAVSPVGGPQAPAET